MVHPSYRRVGHGVTCSQQFSCAWYWKMSASSSSCFWPVPSGYAWPPTIYVCCPFVARPVHNRVCYYGLLSSYDFMHFTMCMTNRRRYSDYHTYVHASEACSPCINPALVLSGSFKLEDISYQRLSLNACTSNITRLLYTGEFLGAS